VNDVQAPGAPLYLDYAATTPVDPRVIAAMVQFLGAEGDFGNPAAATHRYGQQAAARIEEARARVAALVGADPAQIIFTSGATESNNLTLLGLARGNADRGRHLVTTRIEHKAVLDPCRQLEKEGFEVTWLTPDTNGVIAPETVRAALRPDTLLVSVMWANNETGVLQDVAAIGAICREQQILFHTDAAQAVGKIPIDLRALPIDLLSFTAHKIYGPKGVGALYVGSAARPWLRAVSFGGGQERGLRPGTLPSHQIAGFAAACELARDLLQPEAVRCAALGTQLWSGLGKLGGVHLNGGGAARLPGLLNVSFEGVEGESLISSLPELALATGSACNSASGEPSYVLRALGRDTQLAQGSLRFSFGRHTTSADIERTIGAVSREVLRLRALSPASASRVPVPGLVVGEAGGQLQGTWVRFELQIAGHVVKDARSLVYGCPHTMTVTSWVTAQLPGRCRSALVPGTPLEWAHAHWVPTARLGRLLVIEDALQRCLRHWAGGE
jgi:cysteine desulfurase